MLKGLLASLMLSASIAGLSCPYSTDVVVDNHVLTEVTDKTGTEVRIYKEKEVTTIANNAFDGCAFESIMISSTVTTINASFPDTLSLINYTGPSANISFAIPENVVVNEYACDEGFMNYWVEFIRPNISSSICNVDKATYLRMKLLYQELSDYDKAIIDGTADGTGKIADSIAFLDNNFSNSNKANTKEKEISQTAMITLILAVASFGMTSIGLFYLLKDKKVIE